ncbi:hypothetical protein B0H14DRAFT_2512054 [Mycena olivaceomarginata]|nr:hypothetical protein B0H14DRAFT_2512054 [Mycena olivaceomarginata]
MTAPNAIVVEGQKLWPTAVFDTLWHWVVERKAIDDQRRESKQPPWTSDTILSEYKFCNSYRVLDRTSRFAITAVIEKGSQELLFRILLFNSFNRIGTWKLLEEAFGGKLEYAACDPAQYDEVLAAAVKRGEAVFIGAYIKILPPVGDDRRASQVRQLELLQTLMDELPAILACPKSATDVFYNIAAHPGMGPFMTFQLMIILSYSPLLDLDPNDFVVPGPGARSGLTKMFGKSLSVARRRVPDIEAAILRWMAMTQRAHFSRLGLQFAYITDENGHELELSVVDLGHIVCEVDKYSQKSSQYLWPGKTEGDPPQIQILQSHPGNRQAARGVGEGWSN